MWRKRQSNVNLGILRTSGYKMLQHLGQPEAGVYTPTSPPFGGKTAKRNAVASLAVCYL